MILGNFESCWSQFSHQVAFWSLWGLWNLQIRITFDQASTWWNIFMFEDVWWSQKGMMENCWWFLLFNAKQKILYFNGNCSQTMNSSWYSLLQNEIRAFAPELGSFNPPFGRNISTCDSLHPDLSLFQSLEQFWEIPPSWEFVTQNTMFFVVQKQPNLSFPLNWWRWMEKYPVRSDFFSSLKIEKCKAFSSGSWQNPLDKLRVSPLDSFGQRICNF